MNWVWDEDKNEENIEKHGFSFEVAALVFDDPLAATREDFYSDELRWQTIGAVNSLILFVVHTIAEDGDMHGRIISARIATPHERRAYEEGYY